MSSSSSPSVIASVEAYMKALLHCQKYPTQAVSGFLLGKRFAEESDGNGSAFVADAIPLFHSLPMTHPHPMLEVAYAQVSNFARTKGLVMLGYYMANERANDSDVSPLTANVLRMLQHKLSTGKRPILWTIIGSHPTDGVNVRVSYNGGSGDTPAAALKFGRWSSDTLSCETVEGAAAALETFSNAMDTFKQFHIVDFEDHLENVQLNYLEQADSV